MHIPDGFLNAGTAAVSGVLSIGGLGLSLRTVRRTFLPRRIPLIGLTAAFVFAAQMLNFPVAGGTSGHLIGATLAAVLLGPFAAVLALSSVLILQCFLFADGGVTALGANIFNMGIVATFTGWAIYRFTAYLLGGGLRARLAGAAFGAWCSTVAAAVVCAGQLALSGAAAWNVVFPAMAGIHMLIGIGEALITALVLSVIAGVRPELLAEQDSSSPSTAAGAFAGYGLLVALGLAVFVSPFACRWPDGLDKTAEMLGFQHKAAETSMLSSPLPDYAVPGLHTAVLSTIIAGCVGTVAAFILAYVLARILTPKHRKTDHAA